MSRRFGTENTFTAGPISFSAGTGILLPAVSGIIYSPDKIVLATPAATATVVLSHNGTDFVNIQVPATDTKCIPFPGGLNCPIGSGIDITVTGGNVVATLYYVPYDKNPGITKVASRAASFNNVTATRAPNRAGTQAEG